MRLALISDTHGQLPKPELFEGADLVLHAGDIGPDHRVEDWVDNTFAPWMEKVRNIAPLWATYGNHDFPKKWNANYLPILTDEFTMVMGKKIWMSPWSVTFGSWSWMKHEPELTEIYARIPVDTHIIVSHTPPYQLCDYTTFYGQEHVGSKALRVRMSKMENLQLVVCGHIHEARGMQMFGNTKVVNASCVDVNYNLHKDPVTWIELE